MSRWFRRDNGGPAVQDRIRAIEVPVLTEVKRRIGRGDVSGALLYAYPKVLEDLPRAYGIEVAAGDVHEELMGRRVTPEMAPVAEFFDRLYTLYAPVRFGERPANGSSKDLVEVLKSLYAAEPMWRLYLTALPNSAPSGSGPVPAPPASGEP